MRRDVLTPFVPYTKITNRTSYICPRSNILFITNEEDARTRCHEELFGLRACSNRGDIGGAVGL